ncbi:MAG: glycosyltransferase family 47 protein [Anaerolineae bacterium]|nr:glycosyltransferase family 47 protein [Anaerolineae bacterium]
MKIYLLPVAPQFQPATQNVPRYPPHNPRDGYGVEQDMLRYLQRQPHLLTTDPARADWHYLPVFWTRWHLNHEYASTGRTELAQGVAAALRDDRRTFTVVQYDDGTVIDVGAVVQLHASPRLPEHLPIPLLCRPHRQPWFPPRRRYLASFVGTLRNHPVRRELADLLQNRPDVWLVDGNHGTRFYVRALLAADIGLCPRGYGTNSYRLYETMQLGRVPLLVGDVDVRPFRRQIAWEQISLSTDSAAAVPALLAQHSPAALRAMGAAAQQTYWQSLAYQQWCRLALAELAQRG